jgi:hypothetical protein
MCGAAAALRAGAAAQSAVYMCPMHPDVRGKAGDRCERCGMELVATAADYSPYELGVELIPRALKPDQLGRVRFSVTDPKTGARVRRFESVHERVFHLFVLSRDLSYFAHVHPDLRNDGRLEADIAVPRPGAYQLIADFVPSGGPPQLVQRAFVTAGYDGPLNAVPALMPDLDPKTINGMRVELVPPDPRAGREQLLTFELRDEKTHAPVDDLEPFLGASGHLLIASADLSVVFHSHPVAEVSSANGPTVVFQVMLPRPGTYRMWAQFQRHGQVATVPFTVREGSD